MTRLEAICAAHNAAASVAERQGITVTELIQSRTKAAVEGRRILAAELIAKMSVAVIADVLGLSRPGVRLLLGPLRPQRVPPKDVWCARHGDDLNRARHTGQPKTQLSSCEKVEYGELNWFAGKWG